MACLSDWTHKIGVAGLTATNAFLVENYNTDDVSNSMLNGSLRISGSFGGVMNLQYITNSLSKPFNTGGQEDEGSLA